MVVVHVVVGVLFVMIVLAAMLGIGIAFILLVIVINIVALIIIH